MIKSIPEMMEEIQECQGGRLSREPTQGKAIQELRMESCPSEVRSPFQVAQLGNMRAASIWVLKRSISGQLVSAAAFDITTD